MIRKLFYLPRHPEVPLLRLLALLPPLLVLCALSFVSFESRAEAANIVFATGSATVVGKDGASRKAERGSTLEPGETVDTGDGRAQLRFRDGATISLQPGTQFRVEQFRFSEQTGRASEEDRAFMRLIKGGLRAVSGLIGKERREQYRMDTAVGTIGIRGTEYGAHLDDAGLRSTTYVGLIEICNDAGCAQAGPGQTLVVPDAGTRPRLVPGGGVPALTPGAAMPELPQPTQQKMPEQPLQVPQQMPQTYTPPATHGPNY